MRKVKALSIFTGSGGFGLAATMFFARIDMAECGVACSLSDIGMVGGLELIGGILGILGMAILLYIAIREERSVSKIKKVRLKV